jgi:radical SAM superfamily enzyme YgiQ (UPF0313 family)
VRPVDLLAGGADDGLPEREIAAFAPDVVGISIRNLDDVDSLGPGEFAPDLDRDLVARIRRVTGAPVVLGGAGFSLMPEEVLAHVGADHGVVGEGERAFPDLVDTLARGGVAPRLVRGDRPVTGEEIPAPCADPGLVPFYLAESGMMNVQTKRGCPHRCAYCTYPNLEGDIFRFRDPERVADEIVELRRRHGVERVFFADAVFNDPCGHYLRVAEALVRRRVGIRWAAFFRPQGLTREVLALLRESGLYAMELGTDAASDAALDGLDKGFTMAEALEVDRAAREEGIPAAHFIMFGGPGETMAGVREGLANLERCSASIVFAYLGIRIIPGTPLHLRALKEGAIAADTPLMRPRYYFAPGLDRAEVDRAIAGAFAGNRLRIYPPVDGKMRARTMYQFGFRGLLWDLLAKPGSTRRARR